MFTLNRNAKPRGKPMHHVTCTCTLYHYCTCVCTIVHVYVRHASRGDTEQVKFGYVAGRGLTRID